MNESPPATPVMALPNGSMLFCQNNEKGGRIYYSNENGGVPVWDTSAVENTTLISAMAVEASVSKKSGAEEPATIVKKEEEEPTEQENLAPCNVISIEDVYKENERNKEK